MPTNVLRNNQSYPELGYRIDGKGIAYDLQTNQSLSRQEVDRRIAMAEDADPTSNDFAERERKRGGIAGVYDRNKGYINPIAEIGLGLIPGVGPALAAAYGAATGFDREGQGGIGYDAKKGALGAVSGYGLGKLGGGIGNAVQTGARVAEGNGMLTGIKEGAKTMLPSGSVGGIAKSLIGGNTGGLTAADWLKTIAGGVGAGLNYKSDQAAQEEAKNRFARTQGQSELQTAANAQNLINRAPMADNAQALLMARMGSAPTTFAPRDFTKGPISAQSMAAPATGGPQDALAAARTAAGAYQPGQGGVDTSVLELLKKRMLARNA